MRFTPAIFAISLTGALAAPADPIKAHDFPTIQARTAVPSGESTCSGKNNADWDIDQSVYKIVVGVPYTGKSQCDDIKAKVGSKFHTISFTCKGSSHNANVKLDIIANMDPNNLNNINIGLETAFLMPFSCPTSISVY